MLTTTIYIYLIGKLFFDSFSDKLLTMHT